MIDSWTIGRTLKMDNNLLMSRSSMTSLLIHFLSKAKLGWSQSIQPSYINKVNNVYYEN
jgi:hypothetical protein